MEKVGDGLLSLEEIKTNQLERKNRKLETAMSKPVLDIMQLRDLAWTGISTSKFPLLTPLQTTQRADP